MSEDQLIEVEYYTDDVEFIAEVMRWASLDSTIEKLRNGTVSPECDEFMVCELSKRELNELVGYLSHEANHNEKRSVADRICEIADGFELSLYR